MTSYTCLSRFTEEVKLTRDYTHRGGGHYTQPEVWSHSGGSLPAGDGSHSTDQPNGTEVGHAGLSVGFSKVIPENLVTRLSMLILSKAYPGLGYTLPITKLMKT
jgi:hypothetical protein